MAGLTGLQQESVLDQEVVERLSIVIADPKRGKEKKEKKKKSEVLMICLHE